MGRIFLYLLFNATLISITFGQEFQWAKRAGLWAYDYGYGINTDSAGNIYLAGKFELNANFSGTIVQCKGNHDSYIAKYTPSGALAWVRTSGGGSGDYAHCLTTDNSYVYMAGEIEGAGLKITFSGSPLTLYPVGDNDIFIAKYDFNGNLVWAKQAGGTGNDRPYGIAVDQWGNIYICGHINNSATFGGTTTITSAGANDIYVAKFDQDGNFLWVRNAGSNERDEAKSIGVDNAGNVYICGLFKSQVNFEGTKFNSAGYFDAFLAKYNTNGDLQWVKKAGSSWDDVAWSLVIDDADKIYIAGEFNSSVNFGGIELTTEGNADVFVACYNASGNVEWATRAGGNLFDRARGIGTDGTRIFLTGQFGDTAVFGNDTLVAVDSADIFISVLNNKGNFLWTIPIGGEPDSMEDLGYESGNTICGDTNGNIYVSGALLDGGVFGNTTLNPYDRTDIFLIRLTYDPSEYDTLITDTIPSDTIPPDTLANDTLPNDTLVSDTNQTELILAGSSWKYLDDGSNQGTAWKVLAFNDASWKTGNAQLGYGDGDENTIVYFGPDPNKKYLTTYFRKTFVINNTASISGLDLRFMRDDGAVIYINGIEVARDNMPSGSVSYNTPASTAIWQGESEYIVKNVSAGMLVTGTNIIAVEIHQNWGNTQDMSFDLMLTIIPLTEPADTIVADTIPAGQDSIQLIAAGSAWKYLDNGSNQGAAWRENSFNDVAWKTGDAQLGYGDGDEATLIYYGPDPNQKYLTTYFRKAFVINNKSAISSLDLNFIRDDGAVIYINGIEVARDNMPSGTVYYNTPASTAIWQNESDYIAKAVNPSVLVNGTNVISAEIHQNWGNTQDLSFDLKLSIVPVADTTDTTVTDTIPSVVDSVFITAGSSWKYLDNGSNQDTAWRYITYPDSLWKSGNAELGYGDGDEATIVSFGSNSSNKYITTYFRKAFNVQDVASIQGLELSIIRDDGAIVYINGTEVYRSNMPTGNISYTTFASTSATSTENIYQVANIAASALVNGTNLVAVEIHQRDGTSSDLSFNFKLRSVSGAKHGTPPLVKSNTQIATFTGGEKEGKINLRWVTSSEENNDYFIVERSEDGEKYKRVGIVMGAGNSKHPNNYSFDDMISSKDGMSYYYRINLTDYDGVSSLSPAIQINTEPGKESNAEVKPVILRVYPNPVRKSFLVSITQIPDQPLTLVVYNVTGKVMLQMKLTQQLSRVDISTFEPGIYMVGIKKEEEIIFTERIIVQP